MSKFEHQALEEAQRQPMENLVYTAMSKQFFYKRLFVSKFVLEQGAVPLNPFTIFDYYLMDTVDRNTIRRGNNTLVRRADQVWTFGDVSDGVLAEMVQAIEQGKPIKYFAEDGETFREIKAQDLIFESEINNRKTEYLAMLNGQEG